MKALISLVFLASCSCAAVKPVVEVDHDKIEPGGMRVCRAIDEKDPSKLECISVESFVQQLLGITSEAKGDM